MVISLTTTPMMCALILRPPKHLPGQPRRSLLDRARCGPTNARWHWSLRHGRLVMLALRVTIGLNVLLFTLIPKGFFPQEDTGLITGGIVADQSISFQLMKDKLGQLMQIVQADPAVESVAGYTGAGSGGGASQTNTGSVYVLLKPLSVRKISSDEVIARLRTKLVAGGGRAAVPADRAGYPRRRAAVQCRSTSSPCRPTTSRISTNGGRNCSPICSAVR